MKDIILSIYLSTYLFDRPFARLYPTHNTHPYPYPILPRSLLKLDRNDSGPKRLTYLGRNDPPQKLAEMTQAETT